MSNAEHSKQNLEQAALIPVLRARSLDEARAVVDAMLAGGVSIVEVTMTVPRAVELLRELAKRYGAGLLLGSGTVTDTTQVEATIDAGADFVVSPSLHPAVIEKTKKLGKVSIPGALTPTEVITAWNSGADYVKVFPCSALGGASYLKTLRAPFPDLKLIPTGGVTLQTAAEFLKAGACALGVGSDLVNLTAVAEGHPESITQTARAYLEIIQASRRRVADDHPAQPSSKLSG